ncbi:MAG: glycosyltransferase [Clostridia bacterium]|nr:glycosyltransferase [Clostridia bacterium]
MPDKKKILLLMPHMVGGGAERVASLLMNAFADTGARTQMALTGDRAADVVRCDLDGRTELVLLPEILPARTFGERLKYGVCLKLLTYILCKPFEWLRLPVPADFARLSLTVQYHREIRWLRETLQKDPQLSLIAFAQPAMPIAVLAARGLENRVILSERGDAGRLMKKRYGRKFIEKYYRRADAVVFQTEYARSAYPAAIAEKGVVIPNPLKAGLPAPYTGERTKRAVTFCRISRQKNLPLLVDAFARFHKEFPEHSLAVYGDAPNVEGEKVLSQVKAQIREAGLADAVRFYPFSSTVHQEILGDAMYVNSSDFEGLSNAMLESMAIGLPVVCTDCPVGGARSVITDGENGLLVPMQDPQALADAMGRLADDPALSARVSKNAALLRESLSLPAIAGRWLRLTD